MSADDLVVRLQATLDERERRYPVVAENYSVTEARDGLRLVQAHRDILAMYVEAKAQPVRREGREARLRGLDHASAMGRLTTLGLVLQTIARGYGIEG